LTGVKRALPRVGPRAWSGYAGIRFLLVGRSVRRTAHETSIRCLDVPQAGAATSGWSSSTKLSP